MDKLIEIKPMYDPYVNITWQVNDFCNFKCKYCNPGNWAGLGPKHEKPEHFERVKENLDKIISHFEKRGTKGYKFFFSGGEPTVWPDGGGTGERSAVLGGLLQQFSGYFGQHLGVVILASWNALRIRQTVPR